MLEREDILEWGQKIYARARPELTRSLFQRGCPFSRFLHTEVGRRADVSDDCPTGCARSRDPAFSHIPDMGLLGACGDGCCKAETSRNSAPFQESDCLTLVSARPA